MNQSPLTPSDMTQDMEQILRERVHEKHAELKTYSRGLEQRTARRNTTSIVCSALSTILTFSGVALGQAFGSPAGPIWKSLCVLAAICSAISAIFLNIIRSSESAESIEKAHRVDAKLETLELQLDLKQISLTQGLELYSQVLADMPGPDIPRLPLPELLSNPEAPPARPSTAPALVH